MLRGDGMYNKEDRDMFTTKRKPVRKPIVTKNKFANLTKKDWEESNESSTENREISSLTYRDIYRR